MKILHVLNTNRYCGAENVVCQIIGLFSSDDRYEMLYCSPKGDIVNALEERQVQYVEIAKLTCRELKRVIAEQQPDVIHAHDMRASFIASCVCGKIPLISHIHNNAYASRSIGLKSIAYLKAGFMAKHILWVSQSAFEGYVFHKLFSHKSTVLYNVINVEELLKKADSDSNKYDYDVVFLGSLIYPKNPHRLLDVCMLLISKKQDVKIAIIGTGEMEQEIVHEVSSRELCNKISFLGFQNNPYKVLKDARIMIMTSRWEGTPMCALEAMALGVPIVGTPVDGLRQLIVDNENGFLSDDNNILSQHIFDIITNDELYIKLSNNQVKKSQEINDLKKYRDTIEKIYRC